VKAEKLFFPQNKIVFREIYPLSESRKEDLFQGFLIKKMVFGT